MKYWILAFVGLAAGTVGGYMTTQFSQAKAPEYFSISYIPDGVPEDFDTSKLSDSGPRVTVVNGEIHEFGSMAKDEAKSHTFKLRNDGDDPLQLELLGTTCKCTVGDLTQSVVAPQETIDVVLEWKSIEKTRFFNQTATLKTNDPTKRVLQLRVEGRVIQPVWTVPENVVLTQVIASKGTEAKFHIFASEAGLEVDSVAMLKELPDDWMHVSAERLPSDSQLLREQSAADGFVVNVKIDGGLPLDPISRVIQIHTNRSSEGPFEVGVRGAVRGEISISVPNQIAFNRETNVVDIGLINAGVEKQFEISLVVRGKSGREVKMWVEEDGVVPSDRLLAEVIETRQLSNLQITRIGVTIPADAEPVELLGPAKEKLGRLEVLTDHETEKRIVIYVRFAVAS